MRVLNIIKIGRKINHLYEGRGHASNKPNERNKLFPEKSTADEHKPGKIAAGRPEINQKSNQSRAIADIVEILYFL